MKAIDLTGLDYHQTVDDVNALKHLAERLPPSPVIVNIGACFGTSAMAFIEARPDCFVFSIDIRPSPKEVEHLQLASLYQQGRVIRLLGRSQDAGKHWPGIVDLVYVDGSHARDDVIEDIQTWLPHIRPGGIMVCHDYDKPICPGVKPVVDELLIGHYEQIMLVDTMIAFSV